MSNEVINPVITGEIRRGNLVARRINDDLSWGEGAIQPQPQYESDASQEALVESVLDSIEPVSTTEKPYSSCTDGRRPLRVLSGEPVPVREQMVGADPVSGFYVAENLGPRFYANPDAPVEERVDEVMTFLFDNGILPSGHMSCGAGGGFEVITANAPRFAKNPQYLGRTRFLLPEGVYDEGLHTTMLQGNTDRIQRGAYKGLNADTFLQAAQKLSGKRAIAELNDDGRGVHGHVEEGIVRVKMPGLAINEAKVGDLTGGREVFGVNDDRMDRLAQLFSRGNDQDFKIARMALEDFANAGHGTLAKNLPTWVVTTA
jgi:hypothetical protein